jgi:Asp/Glu/hydantoin racemase
MRLLCINPNTTEFVTQKVVETARAIAPPDVSVTGATGRFGARYISTRAASAIAAHATLDAYAMHGTNADLVLLACFGDPGLLALKELAHCPVLGLAEASCLEAVRLGPRFSIITGGERWKPMLEEFVAGMALSAELASVRAVAPTGGEIAANPQAAYRLLADACTAAARDDGAQVVILGGAGLVGIAPHIRDDVPVPVLCSVETGLRAAFHVLEKPFVKPASGVWSFPPPVETIGLATALAARLEGR